MTIPVTASKAIRRQRGAFARGWGSHKVSVTLGVTTWETSIFPYKGAYILPLKAAVRKSEDVRKGATIRFRMTLERSLPKKLPG